MPTILRSADAVAVRRTSDGTLWLHFNCPLCRKNGAGPDPSHHLGVAVPTRCAPTDRRDGTRRRQHGGLHCFRCGARGSLSQFGLALDAPPPDHHYELPITARITDKVPPVPLKDMDVESLLYQTLRSERAALGVWAGVRWETIVHNGAAYDPNRPSTLVLPYRTHDVKICGPSSEGAQYRSFHKKPKVLTFGPRGPAFFPHLLPGAESDVVIVEGWGDALAVPDPYVPLFTMGTENANLLDFRLFPWRRLIIAADGDAPGRKMLRYLARRALRSNLLPCIEFVRMPDRSDPADLGPTEMGRLLRRAVKVTSLEDLRSVQEDCIL